MSHGRLNLACRAGLFAVLCGAVDGGSVVDRGIEQGMGISAVKRRGRKRNGEGEGADGYDHDELSSGEAADRR